VTLLGTTAPPEVLRTNDSEVGEMASLKVTATFVWVDTPVAPVGGDWAVTVGGWVSPWACDVAQTSTARTAAQAT
jgi:hypothetical protein